MAHPVGGAPQLSKVSSIDGVGTSVHAPFTLASSIHTLLAVSFFRVPYRTCLTKRGSKKHITETRTRTRQTIKLIRLNLESRVRTEGEGACTGKQLPFSGHQC